MSERVPLATWQYAPDGLPAALEFLKRTRDELRTLCRVRLWPDRLQVYDVNGDSFEITGLGYRDTDVVPLLRTIGTAFKPESLHQEVAGEYKEFRTSRRRPWAEDRVM